MSKIGRKPIEVSNIQVNIKGQEIAYKGSKSAGVYYVPDLFEIQLKDNQLSIVPRKEKAKDLKIGDVNREWGMHRALLANALTGSKKEFEKTIEIVGLGYKAQQSGNKLIFTLGYSHKIDFPLSKGISVAIDKTGQKLTISSPDRQLVGLVSSQICALRPPEPYKGTGVKLSTDRILRKAAKGK